MPGVLPGGDGWWAYQQAQQSNLLRGLLTQQQTTISNLDGLPVINFGLIPGSSPARYGLQFVNPTTGTEIMFIGVDAAGVPGVHIYDTAGNEEVRLGELSASPAIYGLAVAPSSGTPGGTLQQVGGFLDTTASDVNTVNNTTWAAFGGSNSITAEVGPSGKVALFVRSYITTSAASEFGEVGVQIDSGSVQTELISGNSVGGDAHTVSTNRVLSGLSAGTHTFTLYYQVTLGTATASFAGTEMIVQPL